MRKASWATLAATLLLAPVVLGSTVSKDGQPVDFNYPDISSQSSLRADFEFNTAGEIDFVPTAGGSSAGWGEWFITTVENNTGTDLHLLEFGFPCSGPETGERGWLLWVGLPGLVPPAGGAETAAVYGRFTPVDPDPTSLPPTVYTYINLSRLELVVRDGDFFAFGYNNTGMGGHAEYNGHSTWAWYGSAWDPDSNWARTAVMQVKAAWGGATPVGTATWGRIKTLFE